jgi:tetratricopeptide (TPR) repeat protein
MKRVLIMVGVLLLNFVVVQGQPVDELTRLQAENKLLKTENVQRDKVIEALKAENVRLKVTLEADIAILEKKIAALKKGVNLDAAADQKVADKKVVTDAASVKREMLSTKLQHVRDEISDLLKQQAALREAAKPVFHARTTSLAGLGRGIQESAASGPEKEPYEVSVIQIRIDALLRESGNIEKEIQKVDESMNVLLKKIDEAPASVSIVPNLPKTVKVTSYLGIIGMQALADANLAASKGDYNRAIILFEKLLEDKTIDPNVRLLATSGLAMCHLSKKAKE